MTNIQIAINQRIFLGIDNQQVSRAVHDGTRWRVESVGPQTGVATLAVDPQSPHRVYAGTNGAGLYCSDNAGRDWNFVGLAGRVIKAVAVSPHDSKVIYAGVKPAGIFKTINGGEQWTELDGFRRIPNRWWWFSPAESPFQAYVQAISVSPTEPDVVVAGIELGATVRSEDGGRTWSRHRNGSLRDCHSLKFHAVDGRWVYEAGGSGGGAAVSQDGGRSWRKRKAGLVEHYGVTCASDWELPELWYIATAPSPRQAYGDKATAYLYRASAGADWQPIGWEPHPMNAMPRSLVTLAGEPGQLFAGTTTGDVWHSADYGDSWQRIPFDLGGGLSLLVL